MSRRHWRLLGLACIAVVLFLSVRRAIGLEFEPESIQTVVADLGVWAPLAFVGIVMFRVPLGVPSAVLLIGGGLAFGIALGTLYGATGLVISAVVLFLTARWTGRESIERRVPARVRFVLDVAGSRAGALFIALGTAYPMSPITSYHLLAGVTGMSFPVFLIAATLGCVGRAALYTYFGSTLIEADPGQILIAGALIGLAMVVPLLFPAPRRWVLGIRPGLPPEEQPVK